MSSSLKSVLFTPVKFRGVTIKNRIGVSPMCQYTAEDGFVNDWHMVNYGSFATGGAGLIMIEATGVEARGRISPGCPGLWKDEQIEPMARITKFLKSYGAVPAIQLAHGGRKASTVPPWIGHDSIAEKDGGWETIGPSALAFGGPIWKVPKEATLEDIELIKTAFVDSTKRAVKAGFELIELHFAHGYLISTFLSPITNKRTDKYGGSLENRMRLALEIVQEVRKVLPEELPLAVRVSVTDYVENGWDVEQTIEFCKELKKLNVDFVDCSSGGVAVVDYNPLNSSKAQIDAAIRIHNEVGIQVAAVGKIREPLQAEEILKRGASLVLLGRAFLNDPHWPYQAADVLADAKSFKYPSQYEWCIGWKAMVKWRQDANNN